MSTQQWANAQAVSLVTPVSLTDTLSIFYVAKVGFEQSIFPVSLPPQYVPPSLSNFP